MKWLFYFVLFLGLFALPFSSFSQEEITLKVEEYETIMKALNASKEALRMAENQLIEQNKIIENQEKEIETLERIFSLQELELQTLREYLKMRKNEALINNLKSFGLGFGSGFVTRMLQEGL